MYDVLDVAAYVINKYWLHGSPITNLKLQKILYYIQGYCLRRNNAPAFFERIYRWPYGPVVPEVYFNYNANRSKAIPALTDDQVNALSNIFKKDRATTKVINEVINQSFAFSAVQMVEMTHKESPWLNAQNSGIITLGAMSSFFGSHDPLSLEEN
ncbi:MAG: DUF4065 domain-containing protein [Eubacteriales bacterium]|nr:DUF4065 domain-containing protein [Eubacteriales bacterium]